MSTHLQLQGDIRQAIENFLGDYSSGKAWDNVVEILATVIYDATITLEQASKLDLNLRRMSSAPDTCPTCESAVL